MVDTPFLGYRSGRSPMHRLDVRLKLGLAALATAAAGMAGPAGLAALLGLACALFAVAGFAPAPAGLRALLPLCVVVAAGRGLAEPAGPRWLVFSQPGLLLGLVYGVRLLVMGLLGSLLASSTTAGGVRAAVDWLLRPLPRSFGSRAATMAGLVIASLPLLGRELDEVRAARAARLGERALPLSERALSLVRPLVRKTLLRADTLAAAMEARCYSDEARAAPLRAPRPWEWVAFACCACLIAGLALLPPR